MSADPLPLPDDAPDPTSWAMPDGLTAGDVWAWPENAKGSTCES